MRRRRHGHRAIPIISLLIALFCSAQPVSSQPLSLLQAVEFETTGSSSFRAILLLGRETEYQIGRLQNPLRCYIDLADTVVDQDLVNQKLAVENSIVERIRIGQNQVRLARVVFDIRRPYVPEIYYLQNPWRLVVEIRPEAPASSRSTPEPSAVAPPAESPPSDPPPSRSIPSDQPSTRGSAEPLSRLTSVQTRAGSGFVEVEFGLSRNIPFNAAELADPARIYFDLLGTRVGESLDPEIQVQSDLVRRIRIGQNREGVARVVLDLPAKAPYRALQLEDPPRLLVRVGEESPEEVRKPLTAASLQAELNTLDRVDWERRMQERSWFDIGSIQLSLPEAPSSGKALPGAPPDESGAEILDEIVARVDNDFITLSELRTERALLYAELREQIAVESAFQEALAERERLLLQDLLERRLMVFKGQQMGLASEVEGRVKEFFDNFYASSGLSGDAHLSEILTQRGVTLNDFRRLVRERIFSDLVLEKAILPKVSVLPSEVFAYYQSHLDEYRRPAEIELAEIYLSAARHGRLGARQGAEEALKRLNGGEAFERVATELSDSDTASRGGYLGWFQEDSVNERLETEVLSLEPGQVSGVVELADGFQVVKLLGRRGETEVPFDEVSQEIRTRLEQAKFEKGVRGFKEDLFEESFIEVSPKFRQQYRLSFESGSTKK